MPKSVLNEYIRAIEIYSDLCENALSRKDMLRYSHYKEILDELKEKSKFKYSLGRDI